MNDFYDIKKYIYNNLHQSFQTRECLVSCQNLNMTLVYNEAGSEGPYILERVKSNIKEGSILVH